MNSIILSIIIFLNMRKMDGKTVKYHKYKGSSGKISIPNSIAESLNWNHKNNIGIIIDIRNGQKGLFLWKREKIEDKKNDT